MIFYTNKRIRPPSPYLVSASVVLGVPIVRRTEAMIVNEAAHKFWTSVYLDSSISLVARFAHWRANCFVHRRERWALQY